MNRIYIAGPMSGLPELNFPAFNEEAARLRAIGFDVVNPAELTTDQSTPWCVAMRTAIGGMMTCDTVALLPKWEQSKGAAIEVKLAYQLQMKVINAREIRGHG